MFQVYTPEQFKLNTFVKIGSLRILLNLRVAGTRLPRHLTISSRWVTQHHVHVFGALGNEVVAVGQFA